VGYQFQNIILDLLHEYDFKKKSNWTEQPYANNHF
jgi:hypothetical protein